MNSFLSRLAPALALCLPLLAVAQQRAEAPDAKSPATPLRYQSAFANYKPWQDIKPGHWRQLNDNLVAGSSGGHSMHGMGAAASAPAAQASAPAAPAPQGHQMHQMQGGKK